MLLRTIIFAAVVVLAATQLPALFQRAEPSRPDVAATQATQRTADVTANPGSVLLEADPSGHFFATFRINGKPVDGLVDTGASRVAINESTARRLGFAANGLDFRHKVNTANGTAEAAEIMLDRIEIGGLRVRQVQAMVMRDRALSTTLVGMSFLRKLKSFQVESGRLKLMQ